MQMGGLYKKIMEFVMSVLKRIKKFILFDDNPSINALNKMLIKNVIKDADVVVFEEPNEALQFLNKQYDEPIKEKAVMFLDINMPNMNCWEFLKELEKIEEKIKDIFKIYILSSYIKLEDKKNIDDSIKRKKILGYYNKPLTVEIIEEVSKDKD